MALRSAQGNEFGPMIQPVKGVPLRLTRWAWSLLSHRTPLLWDTSQIPAYPLLVIHIRPNWTAPAAIDNFQPYNEALSKASGLTPPRWL